MLALALFMAVSPSRADVLLLDLKPVAVDATEAKIVDGLVAEALGKELDRWPKKPRLATGNDIRTMVSLEADKASAGCDDAGCMAEIAGAFGARYVISGTLGKLGSDRILQLWLFDVEKSETLTRTNASASTTNAIAFDEVAAKVLAPLSSSRAPSPPVDASAKAAGAVSPVLVTGGIVAGVAGAVAIGTGAFALVLDQRLAAGSGATFADKKQALDDGPAVIGAAAISAGVAVVGLAVAGVGAAL